MAAGTVHGIKAGRAFVLIEAVDRTSKVLNSIKQRIGRFGADMTQLGQTLALRAAAALTPVGFSLATFSRFDDAMRKVEARSTGTGKELTDLREQAKLLGGTTAFTATHIANLQARLAQFGMHRKAIAEAVKPLMLLARAGGMGLDLGTDIMQATDAVTQTMAAFQMPAESAAHIADLLTVALNSSKFNLEELATSLQHAAPTAANFNMTLEETVALTAAMRELGYDASIVGTAFRNMWLRMSRKKGRDDFNESLKALTGRTIEFIDASGNLKNPIEILQQLRGALAGVGNSQAADMIAKLMELRAAGPSMGIMRATDTLARMLTVLEDVGGEAQRVHDQMESGIGGGFRNLESAIERIQISIGEALDQIVQKTSAGVTAFALKISKWIDANAGLVVGIVATIVAVGALGVGLIVLGQLIIATTAIIGLATAAIGAFVTVANLVLALSPAGIVVLIMSLSALVVVLTAATLAWRSMQKGIKSTVSDFRKSFTAIANALKHGEIELAWEIMLGRLQLSFFKFFDSVMDGFEQLISGMMRLSRMQDPVSWLTGAEGTLETLFRAPKGTRSPNESRERLIELLEQRQERLEKKSGELTTPPTADRPAPDISKWLDKLNAMAAGLGKATENLTGGGRQAPDVLEGLRMGTLEAAKAIQEARFNQEESALERVADNTEDMKGLIEDLIDEVASNNLELA